MTGSESQLEALVSLESRLNLEGRDLRLEESTKDCTDVSNSNGWKELETAGDAIICLEE